MVRTQMDKVRARRRVGAAWGVGAPCAAWVVTCCIGAFGCGDSGAGGPGVGDGDTDAGPDAPVATACVTGLDCGGGAVCADAVCVDVAENPGVCVEAADDNWRFVEVIEQGTELEEGRTMVALGDDAVHVCSGGTAWTWRAGELEERDLDRFCLGVGADATGVGHAAVLESGGLWYEAADGTFEAVVGNADIETEFDGDTSYAQVLFDEAGVAHVVFRTARWGDLYYARRGADGVWELRVGNGVWGEPVEPRSFHAVLEPEMEAPTISLQRAGEGAVPGNLLQLSRAAGVPEPIYEGTASDPVVGAGAAEELVVSFRSGNALALFRPDGSGWAAEGVFESEKQWQRVCGSYLGHIPLVGDAGRVWIALEACPEDADPSLRLAREDEAGWRILELAGAPAPGGGTGHAIDARLDPCGNPRVAYVTEVAGEDGWLDGVSYGEVVYAQQ